MKTDHFSNDNLLEDGSSGLFGILDGHGGSEAVRFCVKSVPEVYLQFKYV
jgi:serine/threonine protein phosphatase PrpC